MRVTKRRRRFAKQRDPSDRARDGLFHSLLSQPPAAARRSAKNGPCSPIPEATSAPHEGGIAATQFALNSSRAAIGGPWPSTALAAPAAARDNGGTYTHGVLLLLQLKAKRRPRWSRPLRERERRLLARQRHAVRPHVHAEDTLASVNGSNGYARSGIHIHSGIHIVNGVCSLVHHL